MGDLGTDIAAGYELLIEEHRRLQRNDPNHELLKYISITEGDIGFTPTKDKRLQQSFLERFTNEKTKVFHMWMNYYVAMRRAVDKIEGIDREPKVPPINQRRSIFDDDSFPEPNF